MNKYEEIKEELHKVIAKIIEEEFDAIMRKAENGYATLKENVSKEDVHAALMKKLEGDNAKS